MDGSGELDRGGDEKGENVRKGEVEKRWEEREEWFEEMVGMKGQRGYKESECATR